MIAITGPEPSTSTESPGESAAIAGAARAPRRARRRRAARPRRRDAPRREGVRAARDAQHERVPHRPVLVASKLQDFLFKRGESTGQNSRVCCMKLRARVSLDDDEVIRGKDDDAH